MTRGTSDDQGPHVKPGAPEARGVRSGTFTTAKSGPRVLDRPLAESHDTSRITLMLSTRPLNTGKRTQLLQKIWENIFVLSCME